MSARAGVADDAQHAAWTKTHKQTRRCNALQALKYLMVCNYFAVGATQVHTAHFRVSGLLTRAGAVLVPTFGPAIIKFVMGYRLGFVSHTC